MRVFEYALVEAARKKMTPAELELAQKAAELAERGEPEGAEMLRKIVHDVLGLRYTPVSERAHKAVE